MTIRHMLVLGLVLGATLVAAASASAATRPTMVTQVEGQDLLERTWDHARCTGVPRLGFRTWKGKREFAYLDCLTDQTGYICGWRWKIVPVVKSTSKTNVNRHGQRFDMKVARESGCR